MTIATGQRILAADILKHANASGYLDLAASTVLTIASGAVTQVQNFHRIAGESGADDTLNTITAASDVTDGYILILRPSSDSVTITLAHGGGNIECFGNQNIVLDDDHDVAMLVYDGNLSKWMALGGAGLTSTLNFINDTSNANMTVGLTINMGSGLNEILDLKSSDINHGITDVTETDTFCYFKKASSTAGGVQISGVSELATGVVIYSSHTNDNTTKSTSAGASVEVYANKKSGTNITDPGTDANLLLVRTTSSVRFIFDAEGSAHADVEWTTFDAHNDAALLTGLELAMLDPVKGAFGQFMDDNRRRLQELKIVTFNEDGHHFVNFTRLAMLHTGAIRQTAQRIERLENGLRRIPLLGRLLLGD